MEERDWLDGDGHPIKNREQWVLKAWALERRTGRPKARDRVREANEEWLERQRHKIAYGPDAFLNQEEFEEVKKKLERVDREHEERYGKGETKRNLESAIQGKD